jgi:hypothetical protein
MTAMADSRPAMTSRDRQSNALRSLGMTSFA